MSKQSQLKADSMSYVDTAVQRSAEHISWGAVKATETFDQFSPLKSQEVKERYQRFSSSNPKLAAFLLLNLVFSGVPILLFTIFSLSVLVFSLVTGLLFGIIGALVVTSSIVGFGLLFIIPTVLLTSIAATTLFFWGLVALWVISRYQQRH